MIARRIATTLFIVSLAIIVAVIGFIEWPRDGGRSCSAHAYALVLYMLAAYAAAVLVVVSLIVQPLWRRAGIFVLLSAPYPLILTLTC